MQSWRQGISSSWSSGYRNMTLLHFASALGFSKLVCAMLTWRSENSNVVLESEIDALSQDIEGFTPLMWACAKGHIDTAIMLCKWNRNALNVKNNFLQSPIDIAKKFGYTQLTNEMERLEIQYKFGLNSDPPPLASISTGNTFTYDNVNNFFNSINNNSLSVFTSNITSSLTSTTSTKYIPSSSNNLKSICINASDNNNSNINLSQCSSTASIGSLTSLNSNRSHDGVFLRPGAVSRYVYDTIKDFSILFNKVFYLAAH